MGDHSHPGRHGDWCRGGDDRYFVVPAPEEEQGGRRREARHGGVQQLHVPERGYHGTGVRRGPGETPGPAAGADVGDDVTDRRQSFQSA